LLLEQVGPIQTVETPPYLEAQQSAGVKEETGLGAGIVAALVEELELTTHL
jgi:hypothetical protein